jgi:hypothetical protein
MPAMTLKLVMLRRIFDFPFVRAMIFPIASLHEKPLSIMFGQRAAELHRDGFKGCCLTWEYGFNMWGKEVQARIGDGSHVEVLLPNLERVTELYLMRIDENAPAFLQLLLRL